MIAIMDTASSVTAAAHHQTNITRHSIMAMAMKTQATRLYPFVPSGKRFEASLEFFAALGFEQQWREAGLAGLRYGGAYFILQDIDVPEWQASQMITLEVADLDAFWAE